MPRSTVAGDSRNEFEVTVEQRFTHVRLTIFPDGGVARLRVHGEPVPDPRLLPATIDLAALENGAVVTGCSNMFYSSPANLLMPGLARVMGDGWETARRRDDSNDWVAVRLACAGSVEVVELDTSQFVGNAPGWATLGYDGGDLVARTALQPDTRHRFAVARRPGGRAGPARRVPGRGHGAAAGVRDADGGGAGGTGRPVPAPAARAAARALLRAAGVAADEAARRAAARAGWRTCRGRALRVPA